MLTTPARTPAYASRLCWERLEAALWQEANRPGRDRTVPYARAREHASEQARRAFLRQKGQA